MMLVMIDGTPGPAREVFGLLMIALLLGAPISAVIAIVAGLPAIYLARRLDLASVWSFGIGGAVFGVGCTALFARADQVVLQRLIDWLQFAATAAFTGACCGVLCWFLAERSRRAR